MLSLRHTTLTLLLLGLASPLFAGGNVRYDDFHAIVPEELKMTSDPGAPGASAVILEYADVEDDQQSQEVVYKRIKIFTEEGKKYGDVEIPFFKGSFSISGVKARTIHADGTIVPFTGKIYEKEIAKDRHVKYLAKTFSLPDVEPGSIVEFTYRLGWEQNMLYTTRWIVEHELFTRKEHFSLLPYSDWSLKCYTLALGIPNGKKPQRDPQGNMTMDLENVPAFEAEKFEPPENELKPRVEIFYTSQTIEEPEKFWKRIGKEQFSATEEFIGHRKGVQEAVQELMAASPNDTPEAKLHTIYARTQKLRNLTYGNEMTAQEVKALKQNKNAEDVLKNGYGYRNEINRLFVAMARAAGMDASVVKVSQRDDTFFNRNVQDQRQLNGEVVMVELPGKTLFLDPGTPYCLFGLLSWENTGVDGLKLEKGGGTFVKTPLFTAIVAMTRRAADLHYEDGLLKGTIAVSFSGQEALVHRLQALRTDEAGIKDQIKQDLRDSMPPSTSLKWISLTGLTDSNQQLIARFTVEIAGVVSPVGRKLLLPTAIFEAQNRDPFQHAERHYPVYFDYSYGEADDVSITLPDSMEVSTLPDAQHLQEVFGKYDAVWSKDGQKLDFKRQFMMDGIVFPVTAYPQLRNFYEKVANGDEENAILSAKAVAQH